MMGNFYEKGRGVPRDYAKAMEWYLKAADQNHKDACYTIGLTYKDGQGCEKNCQKAFQYFCKAPSHIGGNEFSSLDLTDINAPEMASLLSKVQPMNKINLSVNQFTSKGLHSILNGLQSHLTLMELDLHSNQIDNEGGKDLLNFIETHPTITKCNVSGNPMSPEMQKSIEEALKKNEDKF